MAWVFIGSRLREMVEYLSRVTTKSNRFALFVFSLTPLSAAAL